jgi:GNAT superfamily N-acetyltransferase
MCDEWMPTISLPISEEHYRLLPRNAAYAYSYRDGHGWLTPRPKHFHALLELRSRSSKAGFGVRQIHREDFCLLPALFSLAFQGVQPFSSLDDVVRLTAARQALEHTRVGGDGPWIEEASYVSGDATGLTGAILITLLPLADPCSWDAYRWDAEPPADFIRRRHGRPHLTWIFVAPIHAGSGVGTALLSEAANALVTMGFTQLLSTFMIGNDRSLLWHWRNGFRLLAHPASRGGP